MLTMKTKMSKREYFKKIDKLNAAKAELDKLIRERGNAMIHSIRDGESLLNDSSLLTDNLINIQQNTINSLQREIDTAEIVEIKVDTTDDGQLKIGYGSRVKMRYYFDDDVEEEFLMICNVDVDILSNKGFYGVCTPASPLFQFINGKTAGYRGTFTGAASRNTTMQYDFEILEVFPPDPKFFEP